MPTPIEFNQGRGDMQTSKDIWLKKITEGKDSVKRAQTPAQLRSQQDALLEVYRQYYDFLVGTSQKQIADELLNEHPEIELHETANA